MRLSTEVLARRHAAYQWRVITGPSYRADMWAALEHDEKHSAAALAKKAYGSFATAWRVRRDFELLTNKSSASAKSGRSKIHKIPFS